MTMSLTNTTAAQDRDYEALSDLRQIGDSAVALIEDLDQQLTEAKKQLEAVTEERDDYRERATTAEAMLENYSEIIQHYNALMQ